MFIVLQSFNTFNKITFTYYLYLNENIYFI